jgi:hypothetical protein
MQQAKRDATRSNEPFPYLDAKATMLPEYVYRAAILMAVILLLWTAA